MPRRTSPFAESTPAETDTEATAVAPVAPVVVEEKPPVAPKPSRAPKSFGLRVEGPWGETVVQVATVDLARKLAEKLGNCSARSIPCMIPTEGGVHYFASNTHIFIPE